MAETDPLTQLEAAAEVAQQAIEGVPAAQWSAPSTCEGWSVEDVVRHVVEGNERLAAALTQEGDVHGGAGGGGTSAPHSGDGMPWAERHRASAGAVVAGFRRPGALERPVTVPAGTMPGRFVVSLRTVESLVHGWDVATSTGQRLRPPDDLVAHADRETRALLDRIPPDRRPFHPPTSPPPGSTPLDRLAALLGRPVD
ncbi:MAG TPA: TIGR03086 family metal-binding protein [Dermatophilaceae bacterium]|nr:TIGR03086 family metal-binding protein [Dermatophilaceae bacterium]